MNSLTQCIAKAGYSDKTLTDKQLARLVGGSAQRRYGLVNRALKAGELVRIQRGVYALADDFRQNSLHPFYIANTLHSGSYVSMESALAYYGWIPEAVYVTTNVIRGRRSKEINHERFGQIIFTPLAINRYSFLELVERVQLNDQTILMAKPIRALMDLVYERKLDWQGLDWFEQSLRIDNENLSSVSAGDMTTLKTIYKHKRMQQFLVQFEQALEIGS
ncbi:MAG: putative transcriptional regulator of viral defense system [Gammaproteobacteria bacterium]|jgi:predicted transcriptional regulator of viral defense system